MEDQTPATIYRLSTTDFHRMGEIGIFAEDACIELIEGKLIERAPIGSRYAGIVMQLVRMLTTAVGDRAIVSPQNPLLLEPHSEPEPDITLLKPREDFYKNTLPHPQIDLSRDAIECYRHPTPGGYRAVQTARSPGRIAASRLPGVEIAVADLLA